jgi:hypothetical protein
VNADRLRRDLRDALIEMVMRYGDASQREGISHVRGAFGGKPTEYWARARRRRFAAVQRLSAALRDVELLGDCDERDLKATVTTAHYGYPLGGRHGC